MKRALLLTLALSLGLAYSVPALWACCAVSGSGASVVNADQTVLMIWNPETKLQHFIRQASFKSDANDVGFLVPSPAKPELAESSNKAFETLKKYTAPPPNKSRGRALGGAESNSVQVIEQKRVAGYDATVLQADTAVALVEWLKNNNYSYSPAVADWAKPYIEQKWFFTALKVAPKEKAKQKISTLQSPALRISFTTEKPLFPYREPITTEANKSLEIDSRVLRVFFLADQRYAGKLADQTAWTGETMWSNKLSPAQVKQLMTELKLPLKDAPANAWLTEFVDHWEYNVAKSDLYFSPAKDKSPMPNLNGE